MSSRSAELERLEWLEADGAGGFASGTASGIRTRRYHALLLPASTPPTGRVSLVAGVDVAAEVDRCTVALSSQRYAPDVLHPDGASRIEAFAHEPWPRWRYVLAEGTVLLHELFVHERATWLAWRLESPATGVRLRVRPFFSARDYHSLQHENESFRFDPERSDEGLVWRPYPGLPAIALATNGAYDHAPDWYRRFLYREEAARGLDAVEDLATPGEIAFDLSAGEAFVAFAAERPPRETLAAARTAETKRRAVFASSLDRAADAYLVTRGGGRTIVAGYPWFTDWGRDTFIALRGLCLATGRLDDAAAILLEWAGAVSEGMLPNRFADRGERAEFNAVDASLWYAIAVHEFLRAADRRGLRVAAGDRRRMLDAVAAIVTGFTRGTRHGIAASGDGLLRAGEPGVQLTWMDAKVGDWVVTPRIGKPVEVQALWLNALRIAHEHGLASEDGFARGLRRFRDRFRFTPGRGLPDVVDVDHGGGIDDAVRPNQAFAVGGLPFPLLDGETGVALVDGIERSLVTPLGLRSLAPGEPGYQGRYAGGVVERDGAYHQGTVWPWLVGPFAEAWVRVRGGGADVKREARERFLGPLHRHLREAGLGHVSEVADGDPPHTPGGCPFQAWSLGELLRLERDVLA